MKELHINLKNFIIIVLNIILVFIIIYSYFNEYREGFSVGDIDNMFNDIKDVTKNINKIPKEINNVDDKLTKKINNIGNDIQKKTEQIGKKI
jgi:peptidoglycan hydrolase CwlO-like protein